MHSRTAKPHKPELMSPAGNWASARAAVENGADAIYFGVEGFNARARADNFTASDLPTLMRYLRKKGVRGYLAINILIFEEEIDEATHTLIAASNAGVDATIVQDIGLAQIQRLVTPDLPIHASTQMTLTDPAAMQFLHEQGVERVVIPREFSLKDIQQIAQKTDAEIEAFVHGALCVAWSGQCLTSEALGGRSANRGQCAQACRQPYSLIVDDVERDLGAQRYLLSPQDLAGIDRVAEMIHAGVQCFKIEGRLKTPEYVANITAHYRKAIDTALRTGTFHATREDQDSMKQSFSRGFTPGFLDGVNHQTLVPALFPKSRGIRLGTVTKIAPPYVEFAGSLHQLQSGDGVVFDNGNPERKEPGSAVFQCSIEPKGKQARYRIGLDKKTAFKKISPGDTVWKTSDKDLNKDLRSSIESNLRTRGVEIVVEGALHKPLQATIHSGEYKAYAQTEVKLEAARNADLSEALLSEKLGKLGNTGYHLEHIHAQVEPGLAIPTSQLNALKRLLVERLDAEIDGGPSRTVALEKKSNLYLADPTTSAEWTAPEPTRLHAFCRSEEQVRAACEFGVDRLYVDFEEPKGFRGSVEVARQNDIEVFLASPRIVKDDETNYFRKLARYEPDGVLIRNLGGLLYFKEHHPELKRAGDFSLNIANSLSARWYIEQGLRSVTASYDLNVRQLLALASNADAAQIEVVLHQYMPMFHMEHCVFAAVLSDGKDYRTCGRPCEHHQIELKDHRHQSHPVHADIGCRNTVFNGHAQSGALYVDQFLDAGIRQFRIEFLREDAQRTTELLTLYSEFLNKQRSANDVWGQLQAAEQLGVTRGTLDS